MSCFPAQQFQGVVLEVLSYPTVSSTHLLIQLTENAPHFLLYVRQAFKRVGSS